MLKVILITALVGAVWAKGYPALKYEQTKVDDDQGLIDEDEIRPQYKKPVYQTHVDYNDEQDLIAEDEPEDKYEQKSVDYFPKRSSGYGGKLKPEGKQGTYKGSDISSEIKHKKNSYESTKVSQEEIEVKTVSKDYGSRLPSYSHKEAPKAYKTPEYTSTKSTYKKTADEMEYAGHIGQSNAQHGSGIKQAYKPKSSYAAPLQERVEVDYKIQSTPYKGGKGIDNSGYSPKQIVVDNSMRPGHYGSQGVYMGYSEYKTKDAYNIGALDNNQKHASYQAPKSYGIYREGQKHGYSSSSHGADSSLHGYGNTGYHNGQSNIGSYHHSGLNSANNEQKHYGVSGYGGDSLSKSQSTYGGSGSEYSGIGGASGANYERAKSSHDSYGANTGANLQSGSGYKSSHGATYNGYKATGNHGIKSSTTAGYGKDSGSYLQSGNGYKSNYGAIQSGYKANINHGIKSSLASGYGHNSGSHLQSDSGYKSNYDASHNGYKSSGIVSAGASGYGINAGSHLQSGSGYKGGYDASHSGYKASGIKSTGSSGYGINSGSHLQSGAGFKSNYDASQSGYKSSGNQGIQSNHASGYGINSGSHSQGGLGYKSALSGSRQYGQSGSSHQGYQSYGSGGATSGIGGHNQYHTSTYSGLGESKNYGNNYGSEYAGGIAQVKSGVKAVSSYGKVASNYGSSHSGGSGYESGHKQNVGKSYHTSSNTYAPSNYHNTKSNGYNQKSIKSSGVKGSYSGGIGGSSGIKSSTGYHGSNLGALSYGNEAKKVATGSGGHYPKGSYQQPKLTQQKYVDDYQPSGVSHDTIGSSSYKGIGDTHKGYPTAGKTQYPTYPKSSGSGIKGGSKTPKYPEEYQEQLGNKYQPPYAASGSYGAAPTTSKHYSPKGGSGIKGSPVLGSIEVSAKKSPYQPIKAPHATDGYSYPSYEKPDTYEPKKFEQKDLSYEAVLGNPGTSNSGSGTGGYGYTSNKGPSSGSSAPVYGSDDKYEMSKPMPYEFKYEVKDSEHGADQYREEKMDDNGYLTGRYGYKDPHGLYRHVEYQASKEGFKVSSIRTNEPGTDNLDPADVHFEVEKGYQSQY